MADGIGLAEKMLGLVGLVVLDVDDVRGEVIVRVESTRPAVVCPSCRRHAEAHDRTEVHLRDVHCFGRPCRLVINKRRWRCRTPRCTKKTWTEEIAGVAPRQVLTVERDPRSPARWANSTAGGLGGRRVRGGLGHRLGGGRTPRRPLVDDPARRAGRALGVDEHSYLSAAREHSTIYATSLVDLDRRIVIDLFRGKSAAQLR